MKGTRDFRDSLGSPFTGTLKGRIERKGHTLPTSGLKLTSLNSIDHQIRSLGFFRSISASKTRSKANPIDRPVESSLASKLITPNRSKFTLDNRTSSSSSIHGKPDPNGSLLGPSLAFKRSTLDTAMNWPAKDLMAYEANCSAAKLQKTRSTLFQKLHDLTKTRVGSDIATRELRPTATFQSSKKSQTLEGFYSTIEQKAKNFHRSHLDSSGHKKFGLADGLLEVSRPTPALNLGSNNYNIQLFLKKEQKPIGSTGIGHSRNFSFADFGKESQLRQCHQQLLELNSPILRNISQTRYTQDRFKSLSQTNSLTAFKYFK